MPQSQKRHRPNSSTVSTAEVTETSSSATPAMSLLSRHQEFQRISSPAVPSTSVMSSYVSLYQDDSSQSSEEEIDVVGGSSDSEVSYSQTCASQKQATTAETIQSVGSENTTVGLPNEAAGM